MGGESTLPRQVIKAKALIHLNLNLRSSIVEAPGRSGPVFAGVFGIGKPLSPAQTAAASGAAG
jgi:hypothetical protein